MYRFWKNNIKYSGSTILFYYASTLFGMQAPAPSNSVPTLSQFENIITQSSLPLLNFDIQRRNTPQETIFDVRITQAPPTFQHRSPLQELVRQQAHTPRLYLHNIIKYNLATRLIQVQALLNINTCTYSHNGHTFTYNPAEDQRALYLEPQQLNKQGTKARLKGQLKKQGDAAPCLKFNMQLDPTGNLIIKNLTSAYNVSFESPEQIIARSLYSDGYINLDRVTKSIEIQEYLEARSGIRLWIKSIKNALANHKPVISSQGIIDIKSDNFENAGKIKGTILTINTESAQHTGNFSNKQGQLKGSEITLKGDTISSDNQSEIQTIEGLDINAHNALRIDHSLTAPYITLSSDKVLELKDKVYGTHGLLIKPGTQSFVYQPEGLIANTKLAIVYSIPWLIKTPLTTPGEVTIAAPEITVDAPLKAQKDIVFQTTNIDKNIYTIRVRNNVFSREGNITCIGNLDHSAGHIGTPHSFTVSGPQHSLTSTLTAPDNIYVIANKLTYRTDILTSPGSIKLLFTDGYTFTTPLTTSGILQIEVSPEAKNPLVNLTDIKAHKDIVLFAPNQIITNGKAPDSSESKASSSALSNSSSTAISWSALPTAFLNGKASNIFGRIESGGSFTSLSAAFNNEHGGIFSNKACSIIAPGGIRNGTPITEQRTHTGSYTEFHRYVEQAASPLGGTVGLWREATLPKTFTHPYTFYSSDGSYIATNDTLRLVAQNTFNDLGTLYVGKDMHWGSPETPFKSAINRGGTIEVHGNAHFTGNTFQHIRPQLNLEHPTRITAIAGQGVQQQKTTTVINQGEEAQLNVWGDLHCNDVKTIENQASTIAVGGSCKGAVNHIKLSPQAHISVRNKLKLHMQQGSSSGVMQAHNVDLKFTNFKVGLEGNVRVPAALPFVPRVDLIDHIRPSRLFELTDNPAAPYWMMPTVPLQYDRSAYPIIIVTPDGGIVNSRIKPLFHPLQVIAALPHALKHATGTSYLQQCTTPQNTLTYLTENAHSHIRALPAAPAQQNQAMVLSTQQLEVGTAPMLVHYIAEFEGRQVALPALWVPPTLNNPVVRGQEGVLYGNYISLQGTAQENSDSTLHVTGTVHGARQTRVAVDDLTVEQKQYHYQEEVVDYHYKKNLFGGKTKFERRLIDCYESQPGGVLYGMKLLLCIKRGLQKGGCIAAGSEGMRSTIQESMSFKPLVDRTVSATYSKARNALSGKTSLTHQSVPHIVPPRVISGNAITKHAGDSIHAKATQFAAESDITLSAGNRIDLPAEVQTYTHGPRHSGHGLTISTIQTTEQIGVPTTFTSRTGNITLTAGRTLQGQGTQLRGQNITLQAGNIVFDIVRLVQTAQVKTSGITGLSYVHQTTREHHQEALQPSFEAERNINVRATTSDVTLVAPNMQADNKIRITSDTGDVIIKNAQLEHSVHTKGKKYGLSFFGSESINALMKQDFRKAAQALLYEFPMLATLDTLRHSQDTPDTIGNGIITLCQTYNTLQQLSQAEDIVAYIKDNISANPGLNISSFESLDHWTTCALPWLQARKIIIAAGRNIALTGVQGECDQLALQAHNSLTLNAAESTSRSWSRENNVSIGLATDGLQPAGISVSAGWARAEAQAQSFINTHFTVHDTLVMQAGDTIELRGAVIETMRVFIEANRLLLTSVQDTCVTRQEQGNIAATITPTGVYPSLQRGRGAGTSAWTTEQTGLYVGEEFWANIRESTHLRGAILHLAEGGTGELASPLFTFENLHDHNTGYYASFTISDLGFSHEAIMLGLSDFDTTREQSAQITRAVVAQDITIVTESSLENLTRDIERAQEIIQDDHVHVRITVPAGTLQQIHASLTTNAEGELEEEQEEQEERTYTLDLSQDYHGRIHALVL